MHAEHGEDEAEQHVGADLGRGRGEERAHHRGRVGVGVGQPDVEREQRELDQHAHGDESERREHRRRLAQGRHAHGKVRDIEGAGLGVEEADPDQDQRGADRADDEILVGGRERPPALALRDEHVARERGDFEKDVDVEGVARRGDAEQAGEREQEDRVEEMPPLGPDLPLHARPGVGHHQRGGAREDQEDEGVDAIQPVLDADRGRPAAEAVRDGAAAHHLLEQQRRDGEQPPADHGSEGPGVVPAPQQHADRRRDQRHRHLEHRQMSRDHRRSCSSISSSSTVP